MRAVLDLNGEPLYTRMWVVPHWADMTPSRVIFRDGAYRFGANRIVLSSWAVENFGLIRGHL